GHIAVRDLDQREQRPRGDDALRQLLLFVLPARYELFGPSLVGHAPLDHRDAPGDIADASDLDDQAEPVEQLRPQLTFLGVHRPDQDEARRVRDAYAFALDRVDAHRGGVEQDIDQVIVEQVDFVDVEQGAVRLGQQARLEAAL